MIAIDKVLLKEVNAARKAPRNFAFVSAPKGTALLMSKRVIGGAVVKDKQKECGGGQVIRGRCSMEKGVLVFETIVNVSPALNKKLRDTIKKSTKLTVKAAFRKAEKVEEINDDRPDDETPDSPDDRWEESDESDTDEDDDREAAATAVNARLAKAKARHEELEARDPALAEGVAELLMQASRLVQANDFEGAALRLDTVEKQLDAATTSPTKTGSDPGAAIKARLAKLKARQQELKSSNPSLAKSLAGLLMQAGSLAQTGDFERAALRLDRAEKQLEPEDPKAQTEPGAEKPTGPEDPKAKGGVGGSIAERLQAALKQAKRASYLSSGIEALAGGLIREANNFFAKGNPEQAEAALKKLADLCADAIRAAGPGAEAMMDAGEKAEKEREAKKAKDQAALETKYKARLKAINHPYEKALAEEAERAKGGEQAEGGNRAEALSALLKQAKTAAGKRDFKKALSTLHDLELELGVESPPDESEGEKEAADGKSGAAVKERLAKLKTQHEALKKSNPALARSAAGRLMQADSLVQSEDFEGAALRLDDVEKLLDAAKSEIPSAPPPKTGGATRVPEQFEKLYQQAANRLPAVGRLAPKKVDGLRPLLKEARDHGDAKRYKEGLEAIKEFQAQANLALRPDDVTLGGARTGDKSGDEPGDKPDAAYQAQLKAVKPLLDQLRKAAPTQAAALDESLTKAGAHAQAGRFAEAVAELEALEGRARSALRGVTAGREIRGEEGPNASAAVAAWQTAKLQASRPVRKLQSALRKTGRPEAPELIAELDKLLSKLAEPPRSLARVKRLEKFINTDPIIPLVEGKNPFGIAVSLRDPLLKALQIAAEQFQA